MGAFEDLQEIVGLLKSLPMAERVRYFDVILDRVVKVEEGSFNAYCNVTPHAEAALIELLDHLRGGHPRIPHYREVVTTTEGK